jgi:hypothetical protein
VNHRNLWPGPPGSRPFPGCVLTLMERQPLFAPTPIQSCRATLAVLGSGPAGAALRSAASDLGTCCWPVPIPFRSFTDVGSRSPSANTRRPDPHKAMIQVVSVNPPTGDSAFLVVGRWPRTLAGGRARARSVECSKSAARRTGEAVHHIARVDNSPVTAPSRLIEKAAVCTAPVSAGTSNVLKSPPRVRTKP